MGSETELTGQSQPSEPALMLQINAKVIFSSKINISPTWATFTPFIHHIFFCFNPFNTHLNALLQNLLMFQTNTRSE